MDFELGDTVVLYSERNITGFIFNKQISFLKRRRRRRMEPHHHIVDYNYKIMIRRNIPFFQPWVINRGIVLGVPEKHLKHCRILMVERTAKL